MTDSRRAFCTLAVVLLCAASSGGALGAQRNNEERQRNTEDRKPSLSLKANPPVGFSPLRVRVVVDVRGGADDYAEFYCPSIEWDWSDGTVSESGEDCDPYVAGKSTIRRQFSATHTFRQAGSYQVVFRLKQKNKTIASSSTQVQVRAGVRDDEFGR